MSLHLLTWKSHGIGVSRPEKTLHMVSYGFYFTVFDVGNYLDNPYAFWHSRNMQYLPSPEKQRQIKKII